MYDSITQWSFNCLQETNSTIRTQIATRYIDHNTKSLKNDFRLLKLFNQLCKYEALMSDKCKPTKRHVIRSICVQNGPLHLVSG
jgi:hypothetical protein